MLGEVCWCSGTQSPACTQDAGYTVVLGDLTVYGPLTFSAQNRGGWDGWHGSPYVYAESPISITQTATHEWTAALVQHTTASDQLDLDFALQYVFDHDLGRPVPVDIEVRPGGGRLQR